MLRPTSLASHIISFKGALRMRTMKSVRVCVLGGAYLPFSIIPATL